LTRRCTVPVPDAVVVPHDRQETPVAMVAASPDAHTMSSVVGLKAPPPQLGTVGSCPGTVVFGAEEAGGAALVVTGTWVVTVGGGTVAPVELAVATPDRPDPSHPASANTATVTAKPRTRSDRGRVGRHPPPLMPPRPGPPG
jgi:hypothetical protein